MKKPSENEQRDELRNKIIGLGERSIRKSYYPELQQRIAELERINRDLNEEIMGRRRAEKLKEKLEEQLRQSMKMEAIGTLAGGIAHDFNNILTAIIGYADIGKLHIERKCHEEACNVSIDLDRLLEAAHRARDLVKQILTFSRQETPERHPVNLGEVINEALKLLRSSIPSSIEIRKQIAVSEELVLADSTKIHQVVMNLCTNGYHAMREGGGTLGIKLSEVIIDKDDPRVGNLHLSPGPYFLLEVSDTGVGMPKSVQSRIFEPFYTTKKPHGGTGMGLAVVHGIVREHKGHITVYSEPGKGTTFRIYLPQIVASAVKHVEQLQQQLPRGSEHILLVEDEDAVMELEQTMLENLGYQVSCCKSPIEAVKRVADDASRYDLVMTDMTMPKMNGAELAREVLREAPDMPVILCTGFSELINEEKAKILGIRRYVMKPLILRDIAITIREILDEDERATS